MQPFLEGRIQGQLASTYNKGITLILELKVSNTYEVPDHLKFPIFVVVVDQNIKRKTFHRIVLI